MHRSHLISSTIPAALICDSTFIWKYGLGMIRPMTPNLKKYITNGYLIAKQQSKSSQRSWAWILQHYATPLRFIIIMQPPESTTNFTRAKTFMTSLTATLNIFPIPASPRWKRHLTFPFAFIRPRLARAWVSAANENAEVMSTEGIAIKGLYSCGNDMNSIMGGHYPGPGAQLGPGMTFAYIAARHASQRISAHGVAKSSPGIIS